MTPTSPRAATGSWDSRTAGSYPTAGPGHTRRGRAPVASEGQQPFGVSWVDDLRYCRTGDQPRPAIAVGAHRGETARLIAQAFRSAQAATAATRDLDVRVMNAAVSGDDGRARFHLGPDSGRCGFRARGPAFEVQTVTLDRYGGWFSERPDEPHGDFTRIHALLAPAGYRVVSFYTGGVDDQGWRWGDVLLRRVTAAAPGWVACSPHEAV